MGRQVALVAVVAGSCIGWRAGHGTRTWCISTNSKIMIAEKFIFNTKKRRLRIISRMSKQHTVGKSIWLICGTSALLALVGCAHAPYPSAQSWAVIADMPEWSPGRPQTYRQVVFNSNGSVQDASVRDQTVESLVEFTQPPGSSGVFPVEPYFLLQDKYETPAQRGLLTEGRGNKTTFYFRAMGRNKFIDAENELLPADLQKLRSQMPPKKEKGRTGTFIQVRLYDATTQAYLRTSNPVELTAAMIDEFAPLQRALASPFQFIDFKPEQVKALAERLSLRNPPFNVVTPSGEVIRLEYFN